MKLLCLHGYGTSGTIFEQQLGPVILALGRTYEWVFVDGEVDIAKPDLAEYHAGPYFAYHDDLEPSAIRGAHELLDDVLNEDGPFDGIVAFSQGASLAVSYLLERQLQQARQAPPFQFAVLFSTGFILSPDPEYQQHILKPLTSHMTFQRFQRLTSASSCSLQKGIKTEVEEMGHLNWNEKIAASEILQTAVSVLGIRSSLGLKEEKVFFKTTPCGRIEEEAFPRFFHPSYTTERISIPTVHITGRQEPPCVQKFAKAARDLCDKSCMIVHEHEDGHKIPNKSTDVAAVVSAIEQAVVLSQMQSPMSVFKERRHRASL